MILFVRGLCVEEFLVEVEASDSIQTLKQKIERKNGLPVEQQRLIFAGRQLDSKRTISDYNIRNESKIHLVQRFRGGGSPWTSANVVLPSGHTLTIDVNPHENTFADLKRMVRDKMDIPLELQRLFLDGRECQNNILLRDCCDCSEYSDSPTFHLLYSTHVCMTEQNENGYCILI